MTITTRVIPVPTVVWVAFADDGTPLGVLSHNPPKDASGYVWIRFTSALHREPGELKIEGLT